MVFDFCFEVSNHLLLLHQLGSHVLHSLLVSDVLAAVGLGLDEGGFRCLSDSIDFLVGQLFLSQLCFESLVELERDSSEEWNDHQERH